MLKEKLKQNLGITLIALIVTIIVLLILAGIILNMVMGDRGVFAKAQWSKFKTNFYNDQEKSDLDAMNTKLQEVGDKNKIAAISTVKITTESGEEKDLYSIKGTKILYDELEEGLQNTIIKVDNIEEVSDENVELYELDSEKLECTYKYYINVKSGKIYLKDSQKYNGIEYFRPECGITKNGEIIEEDSQEKITIHYINGSEQYEQQIDMSATTTTLNSISEIGFTNEGKIFAGWKDITNSKIAEEENEIVGEFTDKEDSIVSEEDEDIIQETEESYEEEKSEYYSDKETIALFGEDVYLNAQWASEEIIMDANGGTVNGETTQTYAVVSGEEYGELPEAKRDGYVFGGWYTDTSFKVEKQITKEDIYDGSISKVYAYWVEEKSSKIATIIYNAEEDGGTCSVVSKQVVKGMKIGNLPGAKQTKKSTYTFHCWLTDFNDISTKINSKYIVEDNITLYAKFSIHMYFDYQGGTYNSRYRSNSLEYKNVKIGGIRGCIYPYAMKEGYKGNGWWTEKNGTGTRMNYYTKIAETQTSDFTVYADWLKPCIISYNLNYITEEIAPENKIRYQKSKYETLASPKRNGYSFLGWYTESDGGTKITKNDIVENDITLYAHWEEITYYAYPSSRFSMITLNDEVIEFNITPGSGHERLNIPLKQLDVGSTYIISFTRFFDGLFGSNTSWGFGCKVAESKVTSTSGTLSGKSFNSLGIGNIEGSFSFKATSSTMYWIWDLGALKDGITQYVKICDIKITEE